MSKIGQTTISDTEAERIQALPALSTSLPIVFDNGAKVDQLSLTCQCCNKEIMPADIRAEVTINGVSASVSLWAVCIDCRLITPAMMRLRDDGTMLTRDPTNFWHERRYTQKQTGFGDWLKAILKQVFSKGEKL